MASLIHDERKNPATGKREMYYRISWREHGRPLRTALGFIPLPDAKKALRHWLALRELGREVEPPKPRPTFSPPVEVQTVREWWGDTTAAWPQWPACPMLRWLEARGFSESSRQVADSARRWIVRVLGDVRLDQLRPSSGDLLIAALRAEKRRSRTCQIYVGWLRRSLEVAVEEGVLKIAPKLRAPRNTDRKAHRWYTPEQTALLFAELQRRAREGICDWDATLAAQMQETLLMRPGEVLTRRWEDLKFNRRWSQASVTIRSAELPDGRTWQPKTGTRTVAVPPILLAAIRDHWLRRAQPADGWIFPRQGDNRWPRGSFKKALASACKSISLPILHPHALRHTGATRLAIGGVDRRTLMEIGGWASGAMLDEVYAHTTDEHVARVLTATEIGAVVPQTVFLSENGREGES